MEDRSEVEEGIEYETIFQIDEIDADTRKEEERQKLYAQVTEEKLAKIPVFTGRRESGINIFETLANVTTLAEERNLDKLDTLRRLTSKKPNRDLWRTENFQEGAEYLLQTYGNIDEIYQALKFKHHALCSDRLKRGFSGESNPGFKKEFNHHLKVFNRGVWLTTNIPHITSAICCQNYFLIAFKTFCGKSKLLSTRWELIERKDRVKKIIEQIQELAKKVNKDQGKDNGKLLQGPPKVTSN